MIKINKEDFEAREHWYHEQLNKTDDHLVFWWLISMGLAVILLVVGIELGLSPYFWGKNVVQSNPLTSELVDDCVVLNPVGLSMVPRIRKGAVLLGCPFVLEDVDLGDLLGFEKDGELITHEVMRIGEDCIVMKGSNNVLDDGCIGFGDFVYEVHIVD